MDSRGTDRTEELPVADTPEDVAVLYSWANLHGAKYRDFSASRREYRAQLRHRAAEQVREQELKAQAEAEAAASTADAEAEAATIQAEASVPLKESPQSDSLREQALREADRASRVASAERVEAARRAEAAAVAEAAARRAEREMAEASASARRQATQYSDSEVRSRESGVHGPFEVPGEISDPYVPNPQHAERSAERMIAPRPPARPRVEPMAVFPEIVTQNRFDIGRSEPMPADEERVEPAIREPAPAPLAQRRQGYRPDEASGVREIYRGPEFEEPQAKYVAVEPVRPNFPARNPSPSEPMRNLSTAQAEQAVSPRRSAGPTQQLAGGVSQRSAPGPYSSPQTGWPFASVERTEPDFNPRPAPSRLEPAASPAAPVYPPQRRAELAARTAPPAIARPNSPYGQPAGIDPNRGRRAQDDLGYPASVIPTEPTRRTISQPNRPKVTSTQRPTYAAEPSSPAWLYAPQTPPPPAPRVVTNPTAPPPIQSSVADTLQHSRERVAARWFALKGVFEQPGQEQQEMPIRQKEIRTPVLAVFSLAGGVGKTSLVATLGRALSSLGEKVLLTDTTSHGLLPFYFGASELRQGVVRTFSPPSGSTDAPIYLLSYDVDQCRDEKAEEKLVEEISNHSKGTHRILLDLTPGSGWVARRMAKMNPTVLVPLAPDMNSVISLQAVEKYFQGVADSDGRPLQPYFLINQFDASLPLHLDVREVLRRQLGDRLLPFVIRRAPIVSEALAEGMTVMDYAPETPIAEDYQNVAAWLRTIAAPATAGFRNVRWSER